MATRFRPETAIFTFACTQPKITQTASSLLLTDFDLRGIERTLCRPPGHPSPKSFLGGNVDFLWSCSRSAIQRSIGKTTGQATGNFGVLYMLATLGRIADVVVSRQLKCRLDLQLGGRRPSISRSPECRLANVCSLEAAGPQSAPVRSFLTGCSTVASWRTHFVDERRFRDPLRSIRQGQIPWQSEFHLLILNWLC